VRPESLTVLSEASSHLGC